MATALKARIAGPARIFFVAVLASWMGRARAQAPNVDLLARSDWKLAGVSVTPGDKGYRVSVNPGKDTYGWAELRLPLDARKHPLIRVEVAGAGPKAQWTLKVQFPPHQEEWLITENAQNGTFSLPIGEYAGRYDKGECIVRFFAVGKGAAVTLKRLELIGAAAEGVVERVAVDESAPLQTIDGGGGQADYPLWTIGKEVDRVSGQEIHGLLGQLRSEGATIARVGAYGDVIEAATTNPGDLRLKAVVHHIKALKASGMKTMFVAWCPTPKTLEKPAKTDAWRDACVASYADFLELCAKQGAPVAYFELQNEPHANLLWWTPEFLASCGLALAKECEKRGLKVEIIGPDGLDDAWVEGWVKGMGDQARIVALKSGADMRGTREMTAHQVSGAIARAQTASPIPRRYWLTEYGCWGWGNPDADRRGEGGPTDGIRYGTAMAELTHFYLQAGISCPSIWELYDVRRIDEVAGKSPIEPPKRWGTVKYKTEAWSHRAHFDTLGHYYRALQPGTRIYAAASDGGLLPTAVRTDDGWRIVLFNRFEYAKNAQVRLPAGKWEGRAWWTVTDSAGGTKTYPLGAGGEVAVGLPAYGIGTLSLGPKSMPEVKAAPVPAEPKAPAFPAGAVLLQDRFDKPATANWLSFDPSGQSDKGTVEKIAFSGADARFVTRKTFTPEGGVRLRVRIARPEDWELSPIPWFDEKGGRFQQVKIVPGAIHLWEFDGTAYREVSDRCPLVLAPGAWHDLLFERKGDRLTLWVDGKYAWDYEGDDLPRTPGRLGIRGHGFEIEEIAASGKVPVKRPSVPSGKGRGRGKS